MSPRLLICGQDLDFYSLKDWRGCVSQVWWLLTFSIYKHRLNLCFVQECYSCSVIEMDHDQHSKVILSLQVASVQMVLQTGVWLRMRSCFHLVHYILFTLVFLRFYNCSYFVCPTTYRISCSLKRTIIRWTTIAWNWTLQCLVWVAHSICALCIVCSLL